VDRGALDIANVRPFALDEYAGDPESPCSNRSYFRREWERAPGARPVTQFDGAAPDLVAEVERYARALEDDGGIDTALLGIGLNGHIAFNEPGSERTSRARVAELTWSTRESARSCWGEATPEHGLTLGLAEIGGSRSLLLLANGAHKARIVARALSGSADSDCPASLLRGHPGLVVVLDAPAASQLLSGAG
jgi:glucosamine-6-phosphate deaminase